MEVTVQLHKQQIIEFLESQGQHDKAQQADGELPDKVDTDKDSGLLSKFGVDPQALLGGLGGGGLGKALGG
jgi:hypothetical protein